MEDNRDDAQRFEDITAALAGAYVRVAQTLQRLPVPIAIPAWGEGWDANVAVPALDRARMLARELPMEHLAIDMVNKLILEWLITFELGGIITVAGTAPWRLDAMEYGLTRVATALAVVEALLTPDEGE